MDFAVVQESSDPPSVDQLRQAFELCAFLTEHDAVTLARNAYGILVRGLSQDSAHALVRALETAGVKAAAIEQRALPALPAPKRLKRADCTDAALIVYDALGRPTSVDWSHLVLVAAGSVNLTEFQRVETERVVYRGSARGGAYPIFLTDVSHKEQRRGRLLLEILLDVEPGRYRILGEEFRYDYLADQELKGFEGKFARLVSDILTRAPHAGSGMGAAALARDVSQTLEYPNRNSFEEEMIWLLWQGSRPAP